MPPGPPMPFEDLLWMLAFEPSAPCRDAAHRHVASWRALVTRQPRRANRQECAGAMRAFGPRVSGELHAGPLASRAARDAAAAR
jgi:hypothetical protein